MRPANVDARVERVIAFYETLTPASLARLDALYADDVRFRDPFNDLHGRTALRRVFEHMFATLAEPRFVVLDSVAQGDACFLRWRFEFRRGGRRWSIDGATHLRFAADGRVELHRDYWDAAEELYAKLPLLGALMRWLRRRLTTPARPG